MTEIQPITKSAADLNELRRTRDAVTVDRWGSRELFAQVDGVAVHARRDWRNVVWECGEHGRQINKTDCMHTRALALTRSTEDTHDPELDRPAYEPEADKAPHQARITSPDNTLND